MGAYFRLLSAERLKIMKSWVWLLVLVSPAIALLLGFIAEPAGYWDLMASQTTFHAMLFLPIFTGIFASFICRFEHAAGGWKQVLVLPVSRFTFYAAKLTVIMVLILVIQLLLLLSLLAAGAYHGMHSDIPWGMLLQSIGAGWLATLPLAALQLLVSLMWSSFGAPLGINFMLTIPNLLIVNSSDIAPYYPWAQPFLLMMPREEFSFGAFMVPMSTILPVVLGSALLFILLGAVYFRQKEI